MTFLRTRLVSLALLLVIACPVQATPYTWNATGGGSYQTITNWTPNSLAGGPAAADSTIFSPNATYTVTFTGSVNNTGLQVFGSNATFGLVAGQTYTVSGTNSFALYATVSASSSLRINAGTLSLTGANTAGAGGWGIGGVNSNNSNTATLTVDGNGTLFTTNGNQCDIGGGGNGVVIVQNGAMALIGGGAGFTNVGATATGNGSLTVTGTGSTLSFGPFCNFGSFGTGTLAVNNGATASFGSSLNVSNSSGSNGTITVGQVGTGTLSLLGANIGNGSGTNGNLNINGGSTLTSNGALTINAGGQATLNGTWNQIAGLITVAGGTLNLNGGTLTATAAGTGITVTSGSVNISGGGHNVLNLTRSGAGSINLTNGNLTVVGTFNNGGSSQTINGNSATDSPQLTVTGGATTTNLTDVFVGLSRRGTLTVDGATLNASTLLLANFAGGTGTVNIFNTNGKILLGASGTSYVGFAGAGALNIIGGSTTTLNTNGQNLYVGNNAGSSGSIEVNGGTLAIGSGTLYLGNGGVGSLLIHGNATVTGTQNAIIGSVAGGSGTATINGSTWTANSLIVGAGGAGLLNIQNGGVITNTSGGAVGFSGGGAGTVNINGGGSWTANGGFTIGDPFGTGGSGILHVNAGGNLTASGSSFLNMYSGGTLDIAGGGVTTGGINASGGRVTWSAGLLTINGSQSLDNETFGTGISLGTPQALTVTGGLTIPNGQSLTLTGGGLTAGSIAGPGTFNLQTGTLSVTSSSLTIGSGNPLGNLVTVGPGLNLRVTNAVQSFTVAADGVLNLTGGTVAAGLMANAGEIDFGSPVAALGSSGQQLTNTGRLAGTGRINANLINNANGRVSVDSGQRLVFAGATNNNQSNGTIEMTGGTVEFTGTLNNNSGSLISGRGTFRGSSTNTSGVGLINNGNIAFTGTTDLFGKVQNNGGGGVTIGGGAVVTFHDDFTNNGSQVFIGAGARASFLGTANGASPYAGTGTAEFLGDLRPGNSPASVSFGGALVLGTSSNLHAEIGGTTLGSQYDHLQVAGLASFAGNLDAQLINGFTPVLGQRFDIVTFGTRQGSFSSFTGLSLGNGLQFTADYDASHFYLAVTPAPSAGLNTWTGTTSGSWNDPSNWAPTGVPLSSVNTQLVFGTTPNAAMTNDIPGTLTLNQMTFYAVAPTYNLGGNGLNFATNGGAVPPQIVLNSTNGVTISAPLTLTNNLTVSGVGNLTLNGAIGGAGSLTYAGTATLILGNNANSYTGGTVVNSSVIQTTATGALPAGRLVSVISGTLDLSNTSQAIGALNLSSSGTNSFSARPIVQGTNAAGLTLGGDITYAPNPSISPSAKISSVLNLGGAARTVNVTASGGDPYDVVITNQIVGSGGLTKAGPGSLVLTASSTYIGATTVTGGTLFLATINALPATSPVVLSAGAIINASPASGTAEVVAGSFNQSLGSVTGPSGASVLLPSGTLTVGTDNTNATFSGTLNLPGSALVKTGAGTQTLTGVDSQISTTVNGGTLAITTDTALGQAGAPVTINAFGTLTYTANATTAGRAFTVNNGTMTTAANQTATLSNDTIAGGFIAGPGAFALTGGTALSGVTTTNSAVINQTGPATFINFSSGGALTVAAGPSITASFTRFTNQGSGSITVGANSQVNVADFQTYGLLNIANGAGGIKTLLTNVGTTPMYFNGGSRTFIGTVGGNAASAGIELNGQNAIVAGGLFVNNGQVTDNSALGISTIIADYGALVKGAGQYDNSPITRNGGKFQSGNSPGVATMGRFVFGPGGVSNYVFAIDDATGAAGPTPDALGHVSGWGLVKAAQWQRTAGATSGDFVFTADASHPLTVAIDTLVNPTTVGVDVPGLMADFDPSRTYSWPAVQWTGTYSGPTDVASLDAATNFDTSGFANPINGTFGWSLSVAQALSLSYTPSAVPEPGTMALTALAILGLSVRRRKA